MSKTILVADDSITIHKVVGLAFSGEDVQVVTAIDGSQALEKARLTHPDLILADVLLPGRNGYDLCALVKQDAALKSTPVVLLAGSFDPFNEEEASRARCDGHLIKPFDTKELVQLAASLWSFSPKKEGKVRLPAEEDGNAAGIDRKESVNLVSSRTRASFLGSNRLLDVLNTKRRNRPSGRLQPLTQAKGGVAQDRRKTPPQAVTLTPEKMEPPPNETGNPPQLADAGPPPEITEKAIEEIVERVVRRMSADVIREIAWEVVPELSEIIIRDLIKEKGLPTKE